MRLWSLHPRYLDAKGLVALWREALLAQAVLAGQTKGYRHHPQLLRFQEQPEPCACLAAYLRQVHAEALRRNYRFDAGKIGSEAGACPLTVTTGQLAWEWGHLVRKLKARAPAWLERVQAEPRDPHPCFRVIEGGVARWEVRSDGSCPLSDEPLADRAQQPYTLVVPPVEPC